jgi:hypothetical protein
MSGYTIGEIVIWLVLAATLGFALGWIARELLLQAKSRAHKASAVRSSVAVAGPEPEAPADKPVVKKAPVKKAAAKKAPAKKAATKKAPAKKTAAKKAAKKTPAKKATPPRDADDT